MFRYNAEGVVLTIWNAKEILQSIENGLKRFYSIVDLGLRRVIIEFREGIVFINKDSIRIEDLRSIKEGFAYKIINNSLYRLDLYSNGKYYKLKPIAPNKAPTIEINGIHMHRIYGIDPWSDSFAKIRSIGKRIKGAKVLDICTGLGYTAIAEVRLGARSVTSIEIDKNVLYLASMNPWSKDLEDPRIEIIIGDAFYVLDKLGHRDYDVIVHDPPRFETAGDLYSFEFYKKIYNVLRRGGILIHYTGSPSRHTNIDILKGVKNRLANAGFSDIHWLDSIQGFKAYKSI